MRLDNRLVEMFASPALAHELFLNYVNDDPISPQVRVWVWVLWRLFVGLLMGDGGWCVRYTLLFLALSPHTDA